MDYDDTSQAPYAYDPDNDKIQHTNRPALVAELDVKPTPLKGWGEKGRMIGHHTSPKKCVYCRGKGQVKSRLDGTFVQCHQCWWSSTTSPIQYVVYPRTDFGVPGVTPATGYTTYPIFTNLLAHANNSSHGYGKRNGEAPHIKDTSIFNFQALLSNYQ